MKFPVLDRFLILNTTTLQVSEKHQKGLFEWFGEELVPRFALKQNNTISKNLLV